VELSICVSDYSFARLAEKRERYWLVMRQNKFKHRFHILGEGQICLSAPMIHYSFSSIRKN
jgi:hypothetical protein